MDILRAYFDFVASVPLWVWPLFLYWYFKYALPSMTQVLHEVIHHWLDDDKYYNSNLFDDNNLLELVLQGPSTFDLAISQLQSSEHRHVREVALWNYSSHTTVKIMETKAVVQVFQALARLPDLKKVSISFNSPFPVAALTAFFKERRQLREQSGRHWLTMPWKTYTSTYGSSSDDGLRELSLYVVELAGTDQELREFCQQLASFHGLERLELRSDPSPTAGMNHRNSFQTNGPRPHHQQNDDDEEVAWVDLHKHRLEKNERALVPILSALEQHPTLTQLAIAATLPSTKQTTATITFSLSSFVTNNQCLQFLKLHLQKKKLTGTTTDGSDPSRIFPDDGWYFVPLAQALAQPSLNATSQLWHLHLTHHNVRRQGTFYETIRSNAAELRPVKHQSLQKEFKTMLRHNYTLRLVTMGNWSDDNIRYDDDDVELLGEPIITLSPRTVDMDAQWNSNSNSRSFMDEMDIGMHPSFNRPPPPPPMDIVERMGPEMMGEIAPMLRAREEQQLAEEEQQKKKQEEEYDPSMDFFLGLNRRGRKRLLGHANNQNDIAAEEWIQAIVDADTKGRDRKQFGLSTTFYWLSMNPSLIRGSTTR